MINKKKTTNQQHEGKLNFRHMIVSKWYVFLISIALLVGGTYAYIQLVPPVYELSAGVLLKSSSKDAQVQKWVSDEINQLASEKLISETVSSYHDGIIYYQGKSGLPEALGNFTIREVSKFPFVVRINKAEARFYGTTLAVEPLEDNRYRLLVDNDKVANSIFEGKFGEPLEAEGLSLQIDRNEKVEADASLRYAFRIADQNKLVSRYAASFDAAPVELEGSPIGLLNLTFRTTSFEGGVNFLNQHIRHYQSTLTGTSNVLEDVDIQKLDTKISELEDSISLVEQQLSILKEETAGSSANAGTKNLRNSLNYSLQASINKIKSYRSLKNSLLRGEEREKAELLLMIDEGDADTRNWLDVYFNNLEELDKLLLRVTENHPSAIRLLREVEKSRERIVNRANIFIDAEQKKTESLSRRLASLGPASPDIKLEDSLQSLEQNLASLKESLKLLEDERSQGQSLQTAGNGSLEVVSPPQNSSREPVWPSPYLYLIAVLLGTAIPMLLLILKRGGKSDIILDKDELLSHSKAPLLGMISNGGRNVKLIDSRASEAPVFQSFKFVGLNLSYIRQKGRSNIIGLTSSVSGEGRTFCSVNLAATLAREGNKTLLINLDQGSTGIQKFLKLNPLGLTEHMQDFASLLNVIQPSGVKNLDVIVPGNSKDAPEEEQYKTKLAGILNACKANYDYIFVKTPPITESSMHFLIARHFDINLFLVRYNYTRKDILNGINDLYLNKKIKNLYLLFNDVEFYKQQETSTQTVTIHQDEISNEKLRKEVASPTSKKVSEKAFEPIEKATKSPAQTAPMNTPPVSQPAAKEESHSPKKAKEPVFAETKNFNPEEKAADKAVEAKDKTQDEHQVEAKEEVEVFNKHEIKPVETPIPSSKEKEAAARSDSESPSSNNKPEARQTPDFVFSDRDEKQLEDEPVAEPDKEEESFNVPIKPNPLREEIERKRLAHMEREKQKGRQSTDKPDTLGRVEAKQLPADPKPARKEEPSEKQHDAKEETKAELPIKEITQEEGLKPEASPKVKPLENKKDEDAEEFTPPGTILPHEEYEEPGFFNRLLGKKKKKKTVYKNPFA